VIEMNEETINESFIMNWLGRLKIFNAYINPIIYFSRKTYDEDKAVSIAIASEVAKDKKSAKKFLERVVKQTDEHEWYHLPDRYDLVFVFEKTNGKYRGSIQSL